MTPVARSAVGRRAAFQPAQIDASRSKSLQPRVPGGLGFVLAASVAGASMWWMKPSVSRLTVSLAATYTVFFAFNKWAFANYYFLMAGLSALAAASACHVAGTGIRLPESDTEPS